jgi:hypothetical protein
MQVTVGPGREVWNVQEFLARGNAGTGCCVVERGVRVGETLIHFLARRPTVPLS